MIRTGLNLQDNLTWLVYSPQEQEIIASGELASASELNTLTEKSDNRDVIVLLPSDQVQLKTIPLPTKWNRKLEQALPYMLEEDLACDIDDLHIAIGDPGMIEEQHTINVGITDATWFEQWLEVFRENEITAYTVLPDALLLPNSAPDELAGIELNDQWLFKLNDWHIAAVEQSWLAGYLSALGNPDVNHYSPVTDFPEAVTLKPQTQDYDLPLALFAKQLPHVKFNLRQGRYQLKKQGSLWWGYWKSAAIAASIALICSITIKLVELNQLNTQVALSKAQVVDRYQRAFPGTKVRPQLIRSQIKGALAKISGGSDVGFLSLTNELVSVFNQVNEFTPETLRYDNRRGELRLRARAKDFQTFGKVKSILENNGLTVEQGSLNNDGDFVVGEIKLRGGA
nr:type II secretion system protein GspL [Pseudoalteromonas sp. MMG010]